MNDMVDRIADCLVEDHVNLLAEVLSLRARAEADEALLLEALGALNAALSDDQPYITQSEKAVAAICKRLGVTDE